MLSFHSVPQDSESLTLSNGDVVIIISEERFNAKEHRPGGYTYYDNHGRLIKKVEKMCCSDNPRVALTTQRVSTTKEQ